MISDEMLKKAAAEAEQAIRDSLPAPAACKHEFSPSFQRKMRRAFRKAKHPIIYKFPKYVASFVLVAILTSSIWLTVDAEARAAFFAWVREQYETFIEYQSKVHHLKFHQPHQIFLLYLRGQSRYRPKKQT